MFDCNMTLQYVWNIYEPCDPSLITDDPFDVFIFSLRKDEEPHVGECIYIEGSRSRIVAIAPDHNRTEMLGDGKERYWKVCAVKQ